ncbi:MAG: hypothetical protein KY446_00535, partial [Proteobacteria bacterium]|nr:hypothetical protein [Pseudomonadota bacterium]
EVVTWVPASPRGRRERGYDQGALLARGVARRLGRPALPLLRRPRRSTSQRGRSEQQRWDGVTFQGRRQVSGRVLLVDDVVTTGSSLSHAAVTLRRAGASGVIGLVVAVADRDRAGQNYIVVATHDPSVGPDEGLVLDPVGALQLLPKRRTHPTLPSRLIATSFCASTANSIGSS